eukprot:Seg102.10 transcript_id=Seg102.10/GoldUCD/mRNA.D3Y31 product="hypothetical protein" protein_id=Seg102.10/GoldUCD/D3Y31
MQTSVASSKIEEMRAQIHSMTPVTQSSNPEIREKQARHCRTCKHAVNMHTRRKDQPAFCFLCQKGICNSTGKQIPCTCQFHSQRVSQQLIANIIKFPSGLMEIMMHDSQGSLNKALAGMGSNACTVIAAVTGEFFLRRKLPLNDVEALAKAYVSIMIDGNDLYYVERNRFRHNDLEARDVVKIVDVKIVGNDIVGILSKDHFVRHLKEQLQTDAFTGFLLILPGEPGLSAFIGCVEGMLYFFDSHSHPRQGAVIVMESCTNLAEFASYIEQLAKRSWGSTLLGSNITQLKIN